MTRSPFSRAMQAFEAADAERLRQVVARYMQGLLNAQGQVQFATIHAFHEYTTLQHPFLRVDNQVEPTRPSSRQIFYQHGQLQVRVKTDGTARRPRPHLVVTLAVGQGWDDEIGKFGRDGLLIPKQGPVRRLADNNDWRNLSRMGNTLEEIDQREGLWASACHFDFMPGFDATGAETI